MAQQPTTRGFSDILPLNGFYYMCGGTDLPGSLSKGTLTKVLPAGPLALQWTKENASPIVGDRFGLIQAVESASGNIAAVGLSIPGGKFH